MQFFFEMLYMKFLVKQNIATKRISSFNNFFQRQHKVTVISFTVINSSLTCSCGCISGVVGQGPAQVVLAQKNLGHDMSFWEQPNDTHSLDVSPHIVSLAIHPRLKRNHLNFFP
jgi:hypothetical protein